MSYFTEGQCHALALALHERTKWPIVVTFSDTDPAMHFLVLTGDGLMMDDEGLKDEEAVMAPCEGEPGADLDLTSPAEVWALVASGYYAVPDMAAARVRASQLLIDYTAVVLQREYAAATLAMTTITPEQAHAALDTLRGTSHVPMYAFNEEV